MKQMGEKQLIIVNQSTGYLTVDICNVFARDYDRIILLAGSIKPLFRQLDDKIEIVEITPYDRRGMARRLLSWLRATRQINRYLKKNGRSADVLYFTNPPMSYMKALRHKGNFGVVEYDIYPDVLTNVNCPSFIVKAWANRKRKILSKAKGIITLSNGMKHQLEAYCSGVKVRVVPNWSAVEISPERIETEDNEFAARLGLQGKFVIMYSGNIGMTHNMSTLLEVASRLKDNERIRFLIIGNRHGRKQLEETADKMGATNIIFHDLLEANELKYSFSCANIGVVTLNDKTTLSSVPSKTYNLLAYGIPLLCISPESSEVSRIVKEYKCGANFESNQIDAIVRFISKCESDSQLMQRLSQNSLKASENFTSENALIYREIFRQ